MLPKNGTDRAVIMEFKVKDSGEEKSLADLLFGFKELKVDALNSKGAESPGGVGRVPGVGAPSELSQ